MSTRKRDAAKKLASGKLTSNENVEASRPFLNSLSNLFTGFLIITVIICLYYCLPKFYGRYSKKSNVIDVTSELYQDWSKDQSFHDITLSSMKDNLCDFPIITEDEFESNPTKYMSIPFVLRGYAEEWPANERWKRHSLIKSFGQRSVSTGSESSIAYGGGAARVVMSLEDILRSIRNTTLLKSSNLFTFDVSILKAIPELRRDFAVPKIFRSWDNRETESNGYSWHMLSLGPTKSGLPFHIHSYTWIAVIHGMKRWFLYPPGAASSLETEKNISALMTVWDWYTSTYPALSHLEKAPLTPFVEQPADHQGYRPLECLQQPGDVVYVPKAWNHMTLNIGETIGIGGQAAYPAAERYENAIQVLENSPLNYQALKAAALGLAHFGFEEGERVRTSLLKTAAGVIQLRPDNFDHLVTSTNDTWLVIYAELLDHTGETEYLMNTANNVAKTLSQADLNVNIGVFNVKDNFKMLSDHQLNKFCWNRVDSDDRKTVLPCVRVYPGAPLFRPCDEILPNKNTYGNSYTKEAMLSRGRESDIFQTGLTYKGPVESSSIADYVIKAISLCNLEEGSVLTTTVKSRHWLEEADKLIRQAVEIEPYNLEARSLHGEILGYLKDKKRMKQALDDAEKRFDELIDRLYGNRTSGIPSQTIASIYQKLGHTFLMLEMTSEAISLLEKSLRYQDAYTMALVSLVIANNMNNNINEAEKVLKRLEAHEPRNPALRDLKALMNKPQVPDTVTKQKHGSKKTQPKTMSERRKTTKDTARRSQSADDEDF